MGLLKEKRASLNGRGQKAISVIRSRAEERMRKKAQDAAAFNRLTTRNEMKLNKSKLRVS